MRVRELAEALGVSQSTCSHHVEMLRKVGFVVVDKVGTSSMVSVNAACCTGLPHAADVVMGTLSSPPCCPEDLPTDVTTRELAEAASVPPYVVFHDSVLREMAARRPQDRATLATISGVGERKLDAYGDAFLQVIREG